MHKEGKGRRPKNTFLWIINFDFFSSQNLITFLEFAPYFYFMSPDQK